MFVVYLARATIFQAATCISADIDSNSISEVLRNSNIDSCCSDFVSVAHVATLYSNRGMIRQEEFNCVKLFLIVLVQVCLITNAYLKMLSLPNKESKCGNFM